MRCCRHRWRPSVPNTVTVQLFPIPLPSFHSSFPLCPHCIPCREVPIPWNPAKWSGTLGSVVGSRRVWSVVKPSRLCSEVEIANPQNWNLICVLMFSRILWESEHHWQPSRPKFREGVDPGPTRDAKIRNKEPARARHLVRLSCWLLTRPDRTHTKESLFSQLIFYVSDPYIFHPVTRQGVRVSRRQLRYY